jgi:hypothetical protein
MRVIKGPLNEELLGILNDFSDWFYQQDVSVIPLKGKPDENEYHTSAEYLASIDKNKHVGFPEITFGQDMNHAQGTPILFRDKITETNKKLSAFFNARNPAVKMYYPAGGYMGWHTNWNAAGYNILMSHSKTGAGFFRYIDPITGETVTIDDEPGWTAKVGYFGEKKEPDKIVWHCARAYCERITFAYIVPDEEMWELMIEDLSQ